MDGRKNTTTNLDELKRKVSLEEVICFVSGHTHIPLTMLSGDTILQNDIGLDGDDAVEFFENFQKKFSVDCRDIRWREHFGPEGVDLFTIFSPSFWKTFDLPVRPIAISDLLECANEGTWRMRYDETVKPPEENRHPSPPVI